ncbi:MAG: GMC family oxidoreductase, partial [Arenicellales bacterium]
DWRNILYDAIVVGSGAAGGMAAKCLCDAGVNVLLLEAGDALPPDAYAQQDRSVQQFSDLQMRQPVQSQGLQYNKGNCHLFTDDLDNPYTNTANTSFNWIRSRLAGGRTAVWSRFAARMSANDFNGEAEFDDGPAWPLLYEDLSPYYDKVETLIGVTGTPEGLLSMPDGRFSPRPSPSYLLSMREQLERRYPGRHLIPARQVGIGNHADDLNAPPIYTSTGSTLLQCDPSKLTFRTNCVVARIDIDRPNHAKGVVFIDQKTKRSYEVSARVVILCASTIESTRILLASTTTSYPTGLANSSGLLGHYLMDHFGGCRAMAVGRIKGMEQRHHEQACIPCFDDLHTQPQSFAGGYSMQMDLRAEGNGNVILTLAVFGEVLSSFENAVTLDESVQDSCGLSVPRIHFAYGDNERHMALHAQNSVREIVEALDFKLMIAHDETLPGGTRAHELGMVRMGATPADSVLNEYNQCWDINNLFVTDGACFPSAGNVGPTLTIMALTARACDYIVSQLRAGNL